ncbi:hypothetical protein [Delftia deserti]|uniref:CopG family transcriptional regulator n=1 Tax=Delftia deserti TaxID=1651218 RepID=A0ABW5EZH2_9BURK
MYADRKRLCKNRVPVYLDDYIYERLTQLVSLQGGEKSVVSRDAFVRGLAILEEEVHAKECAQNSENKRDVGPAYVNA